MPRIRIAVRTLSRVSAPSFDVERKFLEGGFGPVAGVDEVGRGPLAGPVVAAACILDPARIPEGIKDSKLLTPAQREALALEIAATAQAWSVACVSAGVIDEINIFQATKRAMRLAVRRLPVRPGALVIDAVNIAVPGIPQLALVRGDATVLSIAAASILAKVHRDRLMARMARRYPGYAFDAHAGYGTPGHLASLAALGPSPIHRRSFAPVAACLT